MAGIDVSYDGEAYSRASRYQVALSERLIELAHPERHESVLDVGCGDGRVTMRLWGRNTSMRVVGIDVSPSQVAVARRRLQERDRAPVSGGRDAANRMVSFRVQDFQDLNDVELYDLVFSNLALHWSRDPATCYAKLMRSLVPGGDLVVQQGCEGGLGGLHERVWEAIDRLGMRSIYEGWTFPRWSPSREELDLLLRDTGFVEVSVDLVEEGLEATSQLVDDFVAASLLFYRKEGVTQAMHEALEREFRVLCAEWGYDPRDCNLVATARRPMRKRA